jgi:hypothetical protein
MEKIPQGNSTPPPIIVAPPLSNLKTSFIITTTVTKTHFQKHRCHLHLLLLLKMKAAILHHK